MSNVEEPGPQYLPAEIEQHESNQPRRWYDASTYRDGDVVPPRIVSTQEIMQEIRDGYARDANPAVIRARQEAMADWARSTARTIDPDQADSVERLRARIDDLLPDRQPDPILSDWRSQDPGEHKEDLRVVQQPTVTSAPPTPEQQYPAADHPRAVPANTGVATAETVDPRASQPETARGFETQLAIAQIAAKQVRAQQQTVAEAAERTASSARGDDIQPPSSAPARSIHW